jgi:hypothetical protein
VRDARDFLDQACKQVFGWEFWSVSMTDLLNDTEKKVLLQEAEQAFGEGRYWDCLVACRKSFYLEFEHRFDVQGLAEDAGGLVGALKSDAPYFARMQGYVEKHVHNPFEYIVLDHAKIDADLAKEGIDNGIFWNIWRLTPEVYRHESEEWKVMHDPKKQEVAGLRERAAYVLENTTDIILKKEANFRALKWVESTSHLVPLKRTGVAVHEKAATCSRVIEYSPADILEVIVDFATPGLSDERIYWHVFYKGSTGFVVGYVLEEDLDLTREPRP